MKTLIPDAQLDDIRTSQLAGILDVSGNYLTDLTRNGVLEQVPNGTAIRGR